MFRGYGMVTLLYAIFMATASSKENMCRTNRAFVFMKPNAIVPTAISRIKSKLSEVGIEIVEEGSVEAKDIDKNEFLDNHYGVIASRAMSLNANSFDVTSKGLESFKRTFGLDMQDEIAKGNVLSAKVACSKLGVSELELGEKWSALKYGEELAKLGGGFYCGKIDNIFVVNGFYMAMRALYVTPPASIVWMCVEWPESKLSWESFRSEVVGATDPSKASSASIRRILFDDWGSLGLTKQPSMSENGFHASASPWEGFLERMNWLQRTVEEDSFGKELLAAGVSKEMINVVRNDPTVFVDGDSVDLIDHLEDKSATECIDIITRAKLVEKTD